MNKHKMDPVSIVQDTGWTRFQAKTDGQTHRQMNKVKPLFSISTSMKVGVLQISLTAVI